MRFGFYLPTRGPTSTPVALTKLVQRAEAVGFSSTMIGDHVVFPVAVKSPYPSTASKVFPGGGDALDIFSLMTFVGSRTTTLRLVSSVLVVPQRNPLVMAKTLATIDLLTDGRVTVGIGVGWMREEFEALGVPWFDRRGAVTDEYLRIFKLLWTTPEASYSGEFYRFDTLRCLPLPVQKPHPPIWVGGNSKAALRRTARFGDGWHPVGANPGLPLPPDELVAMRDVLFGMAEAEGRDPKSIVISYKVPVSDPTLHAYYAKGAARPPFQGSASQILDDIAMYARLGVSEIIFDVRQETLDASLEHIDRFGEVIRQARDI